MKITYTRGYFNDIKGYCKKAGVSISTVSRIINGNSSNAASKEMQDKIWSIARAGGYVPNTSAQALKQKTGKMYLIIPLPVSMHELRMHK